MPYCVVADVASKVGAYIQLTESSKPTIAEVTTEIARVSAQVNVALSAGEVSIPIDPSEVDLLDALTLLVSREVAYQVRAIAGIVLEKERTPIWEGWHKEFEAALVAMRKGEFTSSGVSDDAGPESHTMNAEEDEEDASLDATFTKGMRF